MAPTHAAKGVKSYKPIDIRGEASAAGSVADGNVLDELKNFGCACLRF